MSGGEYAPPNPSKSFQLAPAEDIKATTRPLPNGLRPEVYQARPLGRRVLLAGVFEEERQRLGEGVQLGRRAGDAAQLRAVARQARGVLLPLRVVDRLLQPVGQVQDVLRVVVDRLGVLQVDQGVHARGRPELL